MFKYILFEINILDERWKLILVEFFVRAQYLPVAHIGTNFAALDLWSKMWGLENVGRVVSLCV